MAEALIAARNLGSVSKGDLVEWRATGTPYGRAEGLPDFVRVKVPGTLLRSVEAQFPKVHTVSRKITPVGWTSDRLRIRMVNENAGLVQGKVTPENAIKDCDCDLTLVSQADNEVVYEVKALTLMRSPNFLGFDSDRISRFTITQRSRVAGVYTFDLEYATSGINATYVERTISYLEQYGLTIISNDGTTIRFQVSEGAIESIVCDKLKAVEVVQKCRYRLAIPVVDSIIAAGGQIVLDHATFSVQMLDKRDE